MGKIFITKKIFDLNNVSLLLPFDNNFQDFSSNNFAVTANGNAQISSAQSKFGGSSALFDGSGDYLQTPNLFDFASQDWTIEFWLYAANTQTNKHIIANIASGQSGIIIWIDSNGTITYDNGTAGTSVGTSYTSYWNQWTHIAVVRSGSTISMYVNGALAGTPTTQTPGTNQFLYIGKSGYLIYDFTGYIDDLRVTKGVARYTSNFTPPGPLFNIGKLNIQRGAVDPFFNNVSLLLPMNTSFADFSNNNFAVTANGNAQISSAQSKFGGGSALFDGSGDYLQTPNLFNFASQDWTIEFWLYAANTQTDKHIIANVGSGQDGINIYIDADSNITYNDGNAITSVGTSYTSYWNQWTHIAVVRSGSTISMYVNGALAGTPTTQTPGTNQFLYIGKSGYSGYDFTGYIDDLRITKGVARYTTDFTPPNISFPDGSAGKVNIINN
jgi:uncharacterized membrane protein